MTLTDFEQASAIVRPALDRSYVYDVSDSDAVALFNGGTVWARIMGDSSPIHLTGLETGYPQVVLGWAR